LDIRRLEECDLDRRNICSIRLRERKKEDLEEGRGGASLLLYCAPMERLSRVYVVKCLLMGEERAILYMAKRDRCS
jgi:hypothetical protein